jgi:hypothetical protein
MFSIVKRRALTKEKGEKRGNKKESLTQTNPRIQ